jgi:hypothetical protein
MYYLEEKELIDHATCDSADLIYAGITETTVPSSSSTLPTINYVCTPPPIAPAAQQIT